MDRLDSARALQILERMPTARVLVVGDLMLDVYVRGGASRISPEAPVPVVRVADDWVRLGGAANVAANLVALGVETVLLGVIGEDHAGEDLAGAAAALGVGSDGLVKLADRPTTVKTRVFVGHQQVARYDREVDEDLDGRSALSVVERLEGLAGQADAIVLEDYDKGVLVPQVIDAAMDIGRRLDIPVVVDPKARHFFDYRGATVFKPNQAELAGALRAPVSALDPAWLERTRKHLESDNLLVTLGGEGMALSTEDGRHIAVPAVARAVYDVSGAGDTVIAVMAATLAAGGSVEEGALLATHAAGVEVGKAGVVTVSPEEIMESVHHWNGARDV